MNAISQRALGMIIERNIVRPMMDGRCGLSEEELAAIVASVCHIEKNIEETCMLLHGCSPRTLERWEEDKTLDFPKHHKDAGGKKYWYLDEIEMWKESHRDILDRVDMKRRGRS